MVIFRGIRNNPYFLWLIENCGAALFVVDIRGAFSVKSTIRYLHDFPVTTLCATPTIYRPLVLPDSAKDILTYPPKCLEHCVGAGEPLNPEVIRQWKHLTGTEIRDGYGQALADPITSDVRPRQSSYVAISMAFRFAMDLWANHLRV